MRIFKGVDINNAFPHVSSPGRVFKGGEGPHPPRALIKPFYLKALMLSMQIRIIKISRTDFPPFKSLYVTSHPLGLPEMHLNA